MKLCRRCHQTEVPKRFRYCPDCKALQIAENWAARQAILKRRGIKPPMDMDLILGKPAKMERYKPRPRVEIISDEEQRRIDRHVMNGIIGRGYQPDGGRNLSQGEIEALKNEITPVGAIRYDRGFIWIY